MNSGFVPMIMKELLEAELSCLIIFGEFTKDFGPWKKGYIGTITWNFEYGNVTEYDDKGEIIQSVDIRLEIDE